MTIVDTPGFSDSGGASEQNKLIKEMMTILNNDVKGANALLIVMKGSMNRIDAGFQKAINHMQNLFGNGFWNNVIIGVSFWQYIPYEINKRNRSQEDEEWFKTKWQQAFHEKFQINIELEFIFIDSHFNVNMDPNDLQISKDHFIVSSNNHLFSLLQTLICKQIYHT